MTGNLNPNGPEWRKWCGDEGPLKLFRKSQRVLRQRQVEAQIDADLKEF